MTPDCLDRHANRSRWRRALLIGLTLATALAGAALMASALAANGFSAIELLVLLLFMIGFAWVALSFWAAIIGAMLMLLRLHPVTLGRRPPSCGPLPELRRRNAVLIPVYNEDPQLTMARVAAMYRSLEATGRLDAFSFYILSDTTDEAIAAAEKFHWQVLCRRHGARERLFYRRRRRNIGRKAGNIADWLDTSGGDYDHMIVLDADSLMTGDAMIRLAALMECNPRTGLIQTFTTCVGRTTPFARALQFACRLYGPLHAVGHSFWQTSEANYFGHNAIIRVAAFRDHCRLPTLSGPPPFGGDILSHDFVEAALLRRAGWYAWMLPEIAGSYEEMPSNLLDFAVRDRRWMQGNLQHARVVGLAGLHWVSRAHLAMGILAYLSSPLWLAFLLASVSAVLHKAASGHDYFGQGPSLFPHWPEYRTGEIHLLLLMTAILLLLPKLLALLGALLDPRRRRSFGGSAGLSLSLVCEIAFSTLLAPIMMLFHTGFSLAILAGRTVGWPAQSRADHGVAWRTAIARHAIHSLAGCAAALSIGLMAPDYLPWTSAICTGLILAVPLDVLSSRARIGRALHAVRLFVIPEEAVPPPVLRMTEAAVERPATPQWGGSLPQTLGTR